MRQRAAAVLEWVGNQGVCATLFAYASISFASLKWFRYPLGGEMYCDACLLDTGLFLLVAWFVGVPFSLCGLIPHVFGVPVSLRNRVVFAASAVLGGGAWWFADWLNRVAVTVRHLREIG